MTKSSGRQNLSKARSKKLEKQPEKPVSPEGKPTFFKEKPKYWLESKQKIQENLSVKALDSRRLQMVSGKRGK